MTESGQWLIFLSFGVGIFVFALLDIYQSGEPARPSPEQVLPAHRGIQSELLSHEDFQTARDEAQRFAELLKEEILLYELEKGKHSQTLRETVLRDLRRAIGKLEEERSQEKTPEVR